MTDSNMILAHSPKNVGLRFGWLIFLALAVQILAVGFVNDVNFNAARVLLVASYVAMFPAVWLNIRRPGIGLVLIGLALNFSVIAANGGSMPIDPAALGAPTEIADALTAQDGFVAFSKDTAQSGADANLRILSDIFPLPGPLRIAFSIGDVFIIAGILVFASAPLWPRRWPMRR